MKTPHGVPAMRFVDDQTVREDRGFLPYPDPLTKLPAGCEEFELYDELAAELPQMLYAGTLRSRLESIPALPVEKMSHEAALVAFRHLSFLTSAYAWADCVKDIDAPHAKSIPRGLAVPFVALAKKIDREPILAYNMYATQNWQRIDPKQPIRFDNLKLIQHFTIPPYDRDEYGFILPHVEIEAKAAPGLRAIPQAQLAVVNEDKETFIKALGAMHAALLDMGETFKTIPSVCDPDVYFKHVRPWIFYFQDITYEGVGHFDRLKGETGAESPSIISFDRVLGVHHQPSELIDHLTELKEYRAPRERTWILAIEAGPSLRAYATEHKGDAAMRQAFNDAHDALGAFRQMHLDAAVQYIKKKGRGPIATGGTDYEKFLGKLIEETKANRISA